MPYDFTKLPQIAHADLTGLAGQVLGVPDPAFEQFPFHTNLLGLPQELLSLTRKVQDWMLPKHRYLYYLRSDAPNNLLEEAGTKFAGAKELKLNGRSYARFNEFEPSPYWYVGTCSNLALRFKEHLGLGAKSTYALHLKFWARELNMPLEFVAARYRPDVSRDLVDALEDSLWEDVRPMFGRKGRR